MRVKLNSRLKKGGVFTKIWNLRNSTKNKNALELVKSTNQGTRKRYEHRVFLFIKITKKTSIVRYSSGSM